MHVCGSVWLEALDEMKIQNEQRNVTHSTLSQQGGVHPAGKQPN